MKKLLLKRLLSICAGVVLTLAAATALAADCSGAWLGAVVGPNSDGYTVTFVFKQDGAKLTGTVQGTQGAPVAIENGKVDGNKISFDVVLAGVKISHAGTINDDGSQIMLTTKTDHADFPGHDLTLKRIK
jgi:hypothetical protein